MEKKKIAAAIAAVYAHISSHEAAMAAGSFEAEEPLAASAALQADVRPNIWGITGRQNMMQANSMMQMRMFK